MGGTLRTIGQLAVGGIGYAIGGPLGFAVANTVFGLAFPQNNGQVQRFGDTNLQGSQVGTFIPQIYGQMGKVQGNIIDCSRDGDGKPAGILIRVKKEKVGGKGGAGAQTQKVEVGYLTAAYMLGEGPLYVDKIVKIDGSDEKTIYNRYAVADETPESTLFGGVLVNIFAKAKKRGGNFTAEFAPDGTLISEISDKIRMYFGTEYQEADTVLQSFHASMPAYRGVSYVVFNQYEIPTQPTFQFYVRSPLTGREEIIIKKFEDAVVPATRRDLHYLWGHVNGAWVTSRTGGRPLCEALAKLCYTEFVAANGIICDASKAYPAMLSITKNQMGAHVVSQQPPDAITVEMRGEEEFITDLSIPFNDYDLNYDDNSAHSLRTDKEQITSTEISIPISAHLGEMVPLAAAFQREDWTRDKTIRTSLLPENIYISVGEVVQIPDIKFPVSDAPTTSTNYYITDQEISPEGIVTLTGVPWNGLDYPAIDSSGHAVEARPMPAVPDIQAPFGAILDGAPLTDDMADSSCILVASCAPLLADGTQSYWDGASCVFENGLFPDIGMSAESIMGVLASAYSYADDETTRINYDKTITITMHNGSLNNSTEDKVINSSANLLALINGDSYNTTYIQFVNSVQTGTNTYQISGLLPGRAGSDFVTSIPIGGVAVLLTDQDGIKKDAYNISKTENTTIGKDFFWQFYATDDTFTTRTGNLYMGNSRLPLSPTYIRQTARVVGTSITIAWCARTRYRAGLTWMQTRASDPDNYLLEFTATSGLGAAVVYTQVVAGATEVTISESDLVAQYGSLPSDLMVNISQISDIAGPGHRRVFSTPL